MSFKEIAIYGSGAFGTAMALSCVRAGCNVTLIARDDATAEFIQSSRKNEKYLPGIEIPQPIQVTANLAALTQSDLVVLATPAQSLFTILNTLKPFLKRDVPIIICAKGIDKTHYLLLSDIVKQQVTSPIGLLSGPSFAIEIAQNQPTAVMLAAESLDLAIALSQPLRHETFRCYATNDLIGTQIAGAVKNVIAIASGIVYGKSFGNNTRAALLSRGLAEMCRLGLAMGAKSETFLGLAGMGDLLLTGTSEQSRNFRFGKIWGETNSKQAAVTTMQGKVVEGVATAEALQSLATQYQVRMPICKSVHDLIYKDIPLEMVIKSLLASQSDVEI